MITTEHIEGCIKNDRNAQKVVYESLYGIMLALCKRYVNPEEAQEVLNNGFLNVFKKIEQYDQKGSFEGWVRKIMINKSLDYLKSHKSYKSIIVSKPDYETTNQVTYNLASLAIDTEELYEMIRKLNPITKAVFNMIAIDGYKHKEVADQLNITEVNSRWHLASARKQLQEMISKKETRNKVMAYV